MLSTTTMAEILRMSVAERLELVEGIWDSITLFPESVEVTQAQIAELEKRLLVYRSNTQSGSEWNKVRAKIRSHQ